MTWALLLHDPYFDDRAGIAADDDDAARARRRLAYGVRARLAREIQGLPLVVDDERYYQETDDAAALHEQRAAAAASSRGSAA